MQMQKSVHRIRTREAAIVGVCALLLAATPAMASGQSSDASGNGELDLREANVTDVSVETSGNGGYRFAVTLIHDDDGESGYANWWQVENLSGEQLGRRELLHAHGTVEFTRSETIEIPSGTERVVVRGHDQTHEYGGQAAIVDLAGGDIEFVRQGPEPSDFSDRAK
jgi:hypothetical protein